MNIFLQRSFAFVISVFISLCLPAQNYKIQKGQGNSNAFISNKSVIIKFTVPSKEQINNDLTYIMSIDHVKALPNNKGYEVRAYANQQQFNNFLTRNIPYEIISQPPLAKAYNMATTYAQMANWDRYPTYNLYEQMMYGFASSYPNICKLDTILTATPNGHKILVIKITDNVNTSENEPQFLYSSSIHGDETTGFILMLRLINYLLTNYSSLPKVANLVNNCEIWICPLANPDGTYYTNNNTIASYPTSIRGNSTGVDLNRNYPDPRLGQHPDGGSWAPETVAFMNFASENHFNMSANFHGGAELLNYPWDTWTTSGNPNCDAAWWERVCTAYVDTTRVVNPTYLSSLYADGVTEGGDWYIVAGGRQDYMNWVHHCREVTMELDDTKTTPTENLNTQWNQNYRALLNYMQESLYGVRGIITDSCNGQPIRAQVWVNSYDQINDSSQVYSALPVGNYHKYMIAGTYSITFSAPGYKSKTLTGISLTNGVATVLNVQLGPASVPDAQFTGVRNDNCSGTVQFTNTSIASTSCLWDFGDGTYSTALNPSHNYTENGTYSVKLTSYNCKGVDSLVRSNYLTINLPTVSSVTGGSNCGAGAVVLSASGNGTFRWFDAASGGNLLGTGSSWTTPSISTTTTYYASAEINYPASVVLGTGSSTSSQTGLTPFSSYYEGSREQYLVKATELLSAGVMPGNITSLAFNVTASGSYAQINFTIKMAHTANTAITGAYGTPTGSFTTVYSNASESTPAVGWKTYTLTTPFNWNGVSNILIDICHDNDPGGTCTNCYGVNSAVAYTATSFNSCFGSYADNALSCGTQASTVLASSNYTKRPNMIFGSQTTCSTARYPVVASINASFKNLSIKAFMEGLYAGGSLLNQATGDSGPQFGAGISDLLTVELHNAASLYNIAYSYKNVALNTNGIAIVDSIPCNISGSYYIVIKHRNSIETWSALPYNFNGTGTVAYDFSINSSQAFGNNLKQMSGSVYAIYGGDATQDGNVDLEDMTAIDNASTAILKGYYPQDVNGDGIVDLSDMTLIDNNSTSIIHVRRP